MKMTKTLTISVEPLEIPDDFDGETEFRAKIAEPTKAYRAALSEALGREIGLKHDITGPASAEPVAPARKPRRTREEMLVAKELAQRAAEAEGKARLEPFAPGTADAPPIAETGMRRPRT
jgi:hypothetical protein